MRRAGSPPLAVSMGDPAGIGPDITLAAFAERERTALPAFVVVGDPEVYRARARALGLGVTVEEIEKPDHAPEAFRRSLPILPLLVGAGVTAGTPNEAAAGAITRSIERTVALVRQGDARAVVTNPINKAVLYAAGFPHPGHTEFLAALAATDGMAPPVVMMLAAPDLRVVPATLHIPLKDVPGALSTRMLIETFNVTIAGLRRYFGLDRPRVVVTGLNPHAGEQGAIGDEEVRIITPAIEAARAQGLDVTGPYPADTLFHEAARSRYDAAVTMYHDQALAPFKAIAFEAGVNVTLGLPFIRTSPDHGTAYGLAGTGRALSHSFVAALHLADRMASADAGAA